MALAVRESWALLGDMSIRDFFTKAWHSLIVWTFLSIVLALLYVLNLFFGEPAREVTSLVPGWVYWLVFLGVLLGIAALVGRDLYVDIKNFLLSRVPVWMITVWAMGTVLFLAGIYFLSKFSGWLAAWFWITWLSLLFFLSLLETHIERFIPCNVHELPLPERDVELVGPSPLGPVTFQKHLKEFLRIANETIPPKRSWEDQANSTQYEIECLAEEMRLACATNVHDLREELITSDQDIDWYQALERAEQRVLETQLGDLENQLTTDLSKALGESIPLEEESLLGLSWHDLCASLYKDPAYKAGEFSILCGAEWKADIRDKNGIVIGSADGSVRVVALAKAWIEAAKKWKGE